MGQKLSCNHRLEYVNPIPIIDYHLYDGNKSNSMDMTKTIVARN